MTTWEVLGAEIGETWEHNEMLENDLQVNRTRHEQSTHVW